MGRVPYAEAVELQHAVRDGLRSGEGPERFLLLEHPHIYTLGRNADGGDVLAGSRSPSATAAGRSPTTGRDSSWATRSST
jgi:lipoate-protein ligase B